MMIDQDGPYCVSTSREGLHPISIAPLNASTSSLAHSLLYVKWCRSMRWGPSHVLYSTVAHCRGRRAPFIASSMVWSLASLATASSASRNKPERRHRNATFPYALPLTFVPHELAICSFMCKRSPFTTTSPSPSTQSQPQPGSSQRKLFCGS